MSACCSACAKRLSGLLGQASVDFMASQQPQPLPNDLLPQYSLSPAPLFSAASPMDVIGASQLPQLTAADVNTAALDSSVPMPDLGGGSINWGVLAGLALVGYGIFFASPRRRRS